MQRVNCSAWPCVRRPEVRRKAGRYIGKALATSLRSSLCLRALVVLSQEAPSPKATPFISVIFGRVLGVRATRETFGRNSGMVRKPCHSGGAFDILYLTVCLHHSLPIPRVVKVDHNSNP